MADFNLGSELKGGKLYLTLSGRVASQNVSDLENRLTSARIQNPKGSVIFDCQDLEYISSAGLRVLLSFHKKETVPIKIINVSPEAYEIFDITGFTEIFEVTKKFRDVSNEKNIRKIGYSGDVTVYYIGDDILMKVYPEDTKLEEIENERKIAQVAMLLEIPALIAYDIVTFNGHYGMLYELPRANTVFSILENSQWKLEQYASSMGKLLKQIHSADPGLDIIPSASNIYRSFAAEMIEWLHASEVEKLIEIINVIPETDTLLYNNFNARNVFVQNNGELILINMMNLQQGNPIFDLGTAYMIHRNRDEQIIKRTTGFSAIQAKKFWEAMMKSYFDTNDLNEISKYEKKFEAAASLISALYPAFYKKSNGVEMTIEDIEFFVSQARRDVFPSVDIIKSLLSE